MKRCFGPVNPLLMMNRAGHRLFQKLGSSLCGHAAGGGKEPCFYIKSATIGDPFPTLVSVCFNAAPDVVTCHAIPPFNFKTADRGNFTQQLSFSHDFGPLCLAFFTDYSGAATNSAGPLDVVRLDYVPGTCHKSGDADPECVLQAYSDLLVVNRIWGPNATRVGDLADNIVVLVFPTIPGNVGLITNWEIKVNSVVQTGVTSEIFNDQIRFTIPTNVNPGDTVTVSQIDEASAQAADGRYCWRFFDMPVANVTGVSFWSREEVGPWLLEPKTGRWRLEN